MSSAELLELYRDRWIHLLPNLLVIDLSHNDRDRAAFRHLLPEAYPASDGPRAPDSEGSA